jgi:hypothetical protein
MPMNLKTRHAYPVEQLALAAQKLGLKKREVLVGSGQQKTRKCVFGGNHIRIRVLTSIGSMVGGDALAMCWLQADV